MSGSNGRRRPPRPRIEMVAGGTSEGEAAAIAAAIEQFLADTAPTPTVRPAEQSRWQRAALYEAVSARRLEGQVWGHSPLR